MPSPNELRSLYGADYFDGWIKDVTAHERETNRFRGLFRRIADHARQGRLLSIGCGLGFELAAARELGYETEGLEMSPVAVKFATENLGLKVHSASTISEARLSRPYDVVTFWDVLEHLPDPLEALRSTRTVLAKGGVIVVRVPNIDGLFPKLSLLLAPFLGEWRHPQPPAHLFEFSQASISRLAATAGLDVCAIIHDEWPREKLILGSRRPKITRILSGLIYPLARMTSMTNSIIVVMKSSEASPSPP